MISKSIERSTLAVTVLAPAAALAASGDPGAGAGMGSHSPASQPTAPKQRQGAMNDDKTAPAGPAHMTRGAADPAAAKGATNVPERGDGRAGKRRAKASRRDGRRAPHAAAVALRTNRCACAPSPRWPLVSSRTARRDEQTDLL
jgi:hypothetical protein